MSKILVIEDEEDIRENMLEILEDEELEAEGAANGLIGVLWAQKQVPDLVVCDVMMPELDGYGVLTALRQNPATELVPFIFLTAKSEKSDVRKGMNLGADDYLIKPFTRTELVDTVRARLKKSAAVEKKISLSRSPVVDESIAQVQQLQQQGKKSSALAKFFEGLNTPQLRMKMAIYMMEKATTAEQRDFCLNLLKQEYLKEPSFFKQVVSVYQSMTPETMKLLKNLT